MLRHKLFSVYAILYFFLIPIPLNGENGLYNTISGLIWCEPNSCVHEVGHKLDDMSGWVSRTEKFDAVTEEMNLQLWENPQENYAEIFGLANGKKENMPRELWQFYDFELAERLINGLHYPRL